MAQTFEDYLNSIGAKQASIGYGSVPGGYDLDRNESWSRIPGGDTYWEGQVSGIPQKPYSFGEQTQAGFGAQPGYVNPSGGFLGYGANPSELTSPGLLRGYSDFVAQDPAREAQQIANRQAEQNLFQQQLEARKRVALDLPTIGQAPQGASALTGIPGGTGQFGGFGGPMPGSGGLLAAGGGGLRGGLHRGKFGGTGLLGGNE